MNNNKGQKPVENSTEIQFSVPRGSLCSCTAHFITTILIKVSQEQLHY